MGAVSGGPGPRARWLGPLVLAAALLGTLVLWRQQEWAGLPCPAFHATQPIAAARAVAAGAAAAQAAACPSAAFERPTVYLLANNPALLNATAPAFRPDDQVVLFNVALPWRLPAVAALRPDQRLLVLRHNSGGGGYWGQAGLRSLAPQVRRVLFLNGQPSSNLTAGLANYEVATTTGLAPDYPRGRTPSTGFAIYIYCRREFPLHHIALVGFTGQGSLVNHNFSAEQAWYRAQGVTLV